MCLLNSVPQHRRLHRTDLQLRVKSLTVINDAIESMNGRQASLAQRARPLVYSLCQKFLIMFLGTQSSACFDLSQLGTGHYSHDMKDGCNGFFKQTEQWYSKCGSGL